MEELTPKQWELLRLYLNRYMARERDRKVPYRVMAYKAMDFVETVEAGIKGYQKDKIQSRIKQEQAQREKEQEDRERKERKERENEERIESRERAKKEWERLATLSVQERYRAGALVLFDDLDEANQAAVRECLMQKPKADPHNPNKEKMSFTADIWMFNTLELYPDRRVKFQDLDKPTPRKATLISARVWSLTATDGSQRRVAIQRDTLHDWDKELNDKIAALPAIEQTEWGWDIDFDTLSELAKEAVHQAFLESDNVASIIGKRLKGKPHRKWHNFIIEAGIFQKWKDERKMLDDITIKPQLIIPENPFYK